MEVKMEQNRDLINERLKELTAKLADKERVTQTARKWTAGATGGSALASMFGDKLGRGIASLIGRKD